MWICFKYYGNNLNLAQILVKEWAKIELVKECFKHNYPNLLYKITTDYNLCTCFGNTKRGIEPLVLRDNYTNDFGVLQPNKLGCIYHLKN